MNGGHVNMRANPVPERRRDYARLITPAMERPEPACGGHAIRLARWREYWRMRETPDPPRDIPLEQMPAIMSGRGGSRNSRGGRPRVLGESQDRDVAALHAEGWGSLRIARRMGVSRSAVLSSLGRTANNMAPAHRPRQLTEDQEVRVFALRAEGMAMTAIAREVHVREGCVRWVLDHARGEA